MKILILCNHGNVRSVGLKYLIQRLYGNKHDVLAAGVEENSQETIEMLIHKWADRTISLTNEAENKASHGGKDTYLPIGKDVWYNPFHHNLQHLLLKRIKDLNL